MVTPSGWVVYDLAFYGRKDCTGGKFNDGTPIDSGHLPTAQFVPAMAFDDSPSTLWGGGGDAFGHFWLGMDFDSMKEVRCVSFRDMGPNNGVTRMIVQAWESSTESWINVTMAENLTPGTPKFIALNSTSPSSYQSTTIIPINVPSSSPSSTTGPTGATIIVILLFVLIALCSICYLCAKREGSGRNNVSSENFNDDETTTRADEHTTIEEKRFQIEQQLVIRRVLAATKEDKLSENGSSRTLSERMYGANESMFSQSSRSNRSLHFSERLTPSEKNDVASEECTSGAKKSKKRSRSKANIVARFISQSLRSKSERETCCDICLGEFEEGDEVAFSTNDECVHGFHT